MIRPEKPRKRPTTKKWAQSLGISTALTPPAIKDYDEPCPFTTRQIAIRAVILQGVVVVAADVEPEPVVEWYREQGIWDQVSPNEQSFLLDPGSVSEDEKNSLRWHQEAEWTLLWVVGKVEALGLPTHPCDTALMMGEIIPALGSDIEPFLASADLRPPGVLLAEEDRHYDLWCRYIQTRRKAPHLLPSDLHSTVLYHREYAFEWLNGIEAWDDVQCDA